MKKEEIRSKVRKRYGEIAKTKSSCCGPEASHFEAEGSCCGSEDSRLRNRTSCCGADTSGDAARSYAVNTGYAQEDISAVPEESNLGLGCGNPLGLAELEPGKTVLDLGSGAGIDCFLAAKRVGETGRVIGVDMTPEMVEKARANAENGGYKNVEFRLGEIENLPVADSSIDMIISNCVINLSTDKKRVFQEAYRTLKPGGEMIISDIVLLGKLPDGVLESTAAYAGCVAGALLREEYLTLIREAGLTQLRVLKETSFGPDLLTEDALLQTAEALNISEPDVKSIGQNIVSVTISAVKPV